MGANFTRNFTGAYSEIVDSLMNKTLIVTTIEVNGSENTSTDAWHRANKCNQAYYYVQTCFRLSHPV